MTPTRKLLSLGHSYVISMNRQLAHAMNQLGSSWEITAAAPTYFHGGKDLRPSYLHVRREEPTAVLPLRSYLTSQVHVFFYGWGLRQLLARDWDMVHCWEEPYVLAGAQIAYLCPRRTPLVFRSAQSINKTYPAPFNWFENYAMARAAGWICSGATVEQTLAQRPGYHKPMSRRIPLGVDVARFRPDPARGAKIRSGLAWDDGKIPVIGYFGRLTHEKGLLMLTNVLDRVTAPWRLLLVGAGVLEPELRKWARQHPDRVQICANITHEEMPAYYNALDLLCLPSQTTASWREQFGRVLVEAFASGVPIIGSDSGEIPNVLGDAGLVVGERDEAGWTRTIAQLLQDPGQRRELAAAGLERAHALYTWPVVAREHLKFFDELLERRAASLPQVIQGLLCE